MTSCPSLIFGYFWRKMLLSYEIGEFYLFQKFKIILK